MSPQRRPLSVEYLEDRLTPTTWNNPWPDAHDLTLSLAPDGTAVGDRANALYQTLNAVAPALVWQREVFRAAQTWAVNANLNIGVVTDGGLAFGTPGRPQGDARFGDLRLAAYGMSPEVLGVASPFEAAAGTWSGDLKLNADAGLGIGRAAEHDLFSVLLHEFGHTLGLDHSTDRASPLYEDYRGVRTGLTAGDVARLQALYGPRTPDAYEGSGGNDTAARAAKLPLVSLTDGITAVTAEGDLTTRTDRDYYTFTAPLNLGGLTVRLQTRGVSLLAPKLTVYDAAGKVVGTATSPGPNGGDLEVRLPRLQLLGKYTVKVEAAADDVFGIGSYVLKVDSLPGVTGVVQSLGGVVGDVTTLLNVDLHTNDSILTASLLPQLFASAGSRFDYAFRGSISDGWDVDYYKVKAPQAAPGTATVMTVMAWGLTEGGPAPRAAVYDAAGRPIAAQVLVNEGGSYTVQVPNAVPGAAYYVKVQAAAPNDGRSVGNYFLGIDYGPQAQQLDTFAADTFDTARAQSSRDLTVSRASLFHFTLSADAGASTADAAVRVTIYDAAGNVVFTRAARAGQTVSGNALLGPGKYVVRLSAATRTGAALPPLAVALAGCVLDDPIGPRARDTTDAPSGGTDASSPPPQWSLSSSSTTTASDPYGDPYSDV